MNKTTKRIIAIVLTIAVFLPTFFVFQSFGESVDFSIGDIIQYGSYPQSEITDISGLIEDEDYIKLNGRYFAIEPINWIVLKNEDGKLFLWSQKAIDLSSYHHTSEKSGDSYANNYEQSDVRHWLVSDFYHTAFNNVEKENILMTAIDNSAVDNKFSSSATSDPVFLISKSEAETIGKAYLSSIATDYSIAKGIVPNSDGYVGALTRTAANKEYSIYYIQNKWGGYIVYYNWYDDAITVPMPIRPAMYVDVSAFGPQFPDGYNFDTDRWHFGNENRIIDRGIYESVFGPIKGKQIWEQKSYWQKITQIEPGVCYGMAFSTAAFLNNKPSVSIFIDNFINHLIDVNYGSSCLIPQIVGNKTISSTAAKIISQYHVAQYSSINKVKYPCDCNKLYHAVYDYVYNNGEPVVIYLNNLEGHWGDGSFRDVKQSNNKHAVFAIGLKGNDTILINDSNYPNKITELKLNRDESGKLTNGWSYKGYKCADWIDDDALFNQYADEQLANHNFDLIGMVGGTEFYNELYNVLTIPGYYLDSDKLLLSVAGQSAILSNLTMYKIPNDDVGSISDNSSSQDSSLFWVENNQKDKINITNNSEEKKEYSLLGNTSGVTVRIDPNVSADIYVEDLEHNSVSILNGNQTIIEVSFSIAVDDEFKEINISGEGAGDKAIITKKETGLQISGLNNLQISISENEDDTISSLDIDVTDGRDVNVSVDLKNNKLTSDFNNSSEQTANANLCLFCKKDHGNTFLGRLVAFFHHIAYYFAHLLGKM